MLNAFKGKRKFTAFGTMSNTGSAGLNWEDQDKFGGGSGMQYNEDEATSILSGIMMNSIPGEVDIMVKGYLLPGRVVYTFQINGIATRIIST
jgi:hypothetical protein